VDIGQTEVAAGVAESQSLVINSKLMEYGCVQVVNLDGVLYRVLADFVGQTVHMTTFESAAGEP
jgi:hypothetical protein